MIAALLLSALMTSNGQAEAMFSRTYQLGEQRVYTVADSDSHGSIVAEIEFKVLKLLAGGRAEIRMHIENLQGKFEGGKEPPMMATDTVTKTANHNLPEKFKMEFGNFNLLGFFAMVAGSTTDAKVRTGTQESWKWSSGDLAMSGKTKVTEVSLATKRLQAEIKATATFQGKDAMAITFNSTYDLADGSLVQSLGHVSIADGHTAFDLKVTRKK